MSDPQPTKPIELFYSYSHKDEKLREKLETHLALLKRQGVIAGWHDRKIGAGQEWANQIDGHLETAQIILLLISADFLASDYCYDIELQKAMERHEAGEAVVIPVILRYCDWHSAPFGKLQALPKDARPVTDWANRDAAFHNVVHGLRRAIDEIVIHIGQAPAHNLSQSTPASNTSHPGHPSSQAASSASTAKGTTGSKIKILFLAANPSGTVPLKLDEEMRTIREKVRASAHRDLIDIVSEWAVRPDDLLQALNEHKPHIVHFSGHGTSAEEIILHDVHGKPQSVTKQALSALFRTLKDNIAVVVLNACYSQPQAEAITEQIPCAIGMSKAIGDRAAIAFASSFYRAIGFGRSVQEAFDQGITSLLLEGIAEENTPQLLTRADINVAAITLVNPL